MLISHRIVMSHFKLKQLIFFFDSRTVTIRFRMAQTLFGSVRFVDIGFR